jgi:tetratricopeptide (TPR) repeat protein
MKKKQSVQEPLNANSYVHVLYPLSIILTISIFLYIKSLSFGLTQLDDSIFIKDFHDLFSNSKNLGHLFFRGVFFETNDSYYRPLLMVSFMFNKLISGNLFGYHVTNLFFHLSSCVLLYYFFLKLNLRSDISFLFTLLFAVHPALSQAVVWIPGRNDSMLTTFALASFLCMINYLETKKWHHFALHLLFFWMALYTKESGIILPVLAFGYLLLLTRTEIKSYILLIAGWSVIGLSWLYMRSISIDPLIKPTASEYTEGFINRLPLLVHYLGKSFLPFNLSVFPMQADTTIYLGLAATVLLAICLFLNKSSNKQMLLFGLSWFVLFLLPAFFVPKQINEQAFEHRLYLPIIGLLILLSQTIPYSEKYIPNQKITFWITLFFAAIFLAINYGHQQKFKNEITFWENAVLDSPSSSYAHKILGVKYFTKSAFEKSRVEIQKALEMDSTERYASLYYAKYLQTKNAKDPKIEYYLLREEQYNPGFLDNLFELAKVSFDKGDKEAAKHYLEECTHVAPNFMMAKNNLILLLIETGQKQEALDKINQWKKDKSGVPDGLEEQINKMS